MSGVRDIDRGFRAFVNRITAPKGTKVAVGIFASDGQTPTSSGATLIDVAIWNEFGTDTIPARSFIRGWFDEEQAQIRARLRAQLRAVASGRLSWKQALDQFGLWMQGQIQKRIAEGIAPENARSTVRKKGSSKALIDKGQLRSSVTFAVDLGTGELKPTTSRAGRAGRDSRGR